MGKQGKQGLFGRKFTTYIIKQLIILKYLLFFLVEVHDMLCGLLSWSSWALPWRKKDGGVMWPSPPHFFVFRFFGVRDSSQPVPSLGI